MSDDEERSSSSVHSEMMTARCGRTRLAPEEERQRPAPPVKTCSSCKRALGRPCYECLTCQPKLFMLCQRCEEVLDTSGGGLFDFDDLHNVDHVFKKYR